MCACVAYNFSGLIIFVDCSFTEIDLYCRIKFQGLICSYIQNPFKFQAIQCVSVCVSVCVCVVVCICMCML